MLLLGLQQGDPLPPSLVDLVRNSPISSVDDLKLLLQQEANAIGTNTHTHMGTHTYTWANNIDMEEVSVWVCLKRPEEAGMQQRVLWQYWHATAGVTDQADRVRETISLFIWTEMQMQRKNLKNWILLHILDNILYNKHSKGHSQLKNS